MNVRARLCTALLAAVPFAMGCPSKSGTDGGVDSGPGNQNHDGGPTVDGGHGDGGFDAGFDAGPSGCQSDWDCLSSGLRCASDGGCTLPAQPCDPSQGSDNCSVSAAYCWTDGINTTNNCYCAPYTDGGLCYVQTPSCGPCSGQLQCGPAAQVDNPGYCGQVGTEGTFCLPLDTGGCDSFPGYVAGSVDNMNVCVPSCGACPCSACVTDSDCPVPAVGVCNENNGACEPPCQTQTDCANGEVCNVLGKYLDPTLGTLYAAGKCGDPCTQDSDCSIYQGDAGQTFYCDLDAGALCRPTGCIHDSECAPVGPPPGDVIAWCDIWNGNACDGTSCRIGDNPVGDVLYDDCIGGYTCFLPDGGLGAVPDAGAPIDGVCLPIPCYEIPGGAHTDCTAGQFCCGEGDAGTDCGGADAGECYAAPQPPWCAACDPTNGAYFTPDCANITGTYPGPVACLTASGIQHNPPSWCSPTCDPNEEWTCPSGWNCATQPAIFTDCSSCAECLDAGQDMGTQLYQCGCGGLIGCPSVVQALYEGTSCSSCPGGAANCQQAADGTGFNCLCAPDAGACPSTSYAGQSVPSVCSSVQGTFACALVIQAECDLTVEADGGLATTGVCNLGHNCTSGHYGCPDAG